MNVATYFDDINDIKAGLSFVSQRLIFLSFKLSLVRWFASCQ